MLTYEDSGVSVKKNDELVDKIRDLTEITTGFSDIRPIPGTDIFIVQCCDGTGTKIHLASRYYDLHKTIGQDVVAMCVNDLICSGASLNFFQDYIGMNELKEEIVEYLITSINDACKQCGVTLTGGEMAEMPGTYKRSIPELVGFATGFVDEKHIIDKKNVKAGDIIVALPSSGPHSNGYSLIRKIIYGKSLKNAFLKDLCEPTTLYHAVSDIHQENPKLIKSMAHITGGGLENNLARALPEGLKAKIHFNRWTVPDVFLAIQNLGNVEPDSMWSTFNMGIGMCLIVDPHNASDVMLKLTGHHSAFSMGVIVDK